VNDAPFVCGVERVPNLDPEPQDLLKRQGFTLDTVLQRLAIQKLHDNEGLSVLFVNLVDRADVRVIQGGGSFGLPLKSD
jgi:hypothetical protein